MQASEIWLPVVGYEGLYSVSSYGRIKSHEKQVGPIWYAERILKQVINNGYCVVCLHKNASQSNKKIHRLFATAFIPNPENKPHINHKNGIKSDNRLENLEWASARENSQHACDIGLQMPMQGEKNGASKLSLQQVLEIKNLLQIGIRQRIIAKQYNISKGHVCMINNNKSWSHI